MRHHLSSTILYGADYNPEQWPEEMVAEDVRLMRGARITCATIGVFSWAKLQPNAGTFDFGWLDRVVEQLTDAGIDLILATPTAAPPAWLWRPHGDEILPVDASGARLEGGSRHHYCPNSTLYRAAAREIASRLAARYSTHPGLLLWHIDNEYNGECYCDRCASAFRTWLRSRYHTLDALNTAWNTAFWSERYGDWEEIIPPRRTRTFNNNGQVLDYRRFLSDSYLACYLEQREALREYSPDIPATTNFMGWFQGIDYWTWAPHLDVISWDSYPPPDSPPWLPAGWHDMMRSLKDAPFVLMEQSPSQVNWMPCNRPRRPGEVRAASYSAIARGADGVCYFQFRQSRGGPEQFHAGIVAHAGAQRSRVYGEVASLGAEIAALPAEILGSTVPVRVAIVFDWPSWWAAEQQPKVSNEVHYLDEVQRYYRAFWNLNVLVDFAPAGGPFDRYDLIVVPALRIVTDETAAALTSAVERGATAIVTFGSGLTDANDRAHLGGYPGPLREVCGIWIEEFDLLCGNGTESACMGPLSFTCSSWCDAIHLDGAQALAEFTSGFCSGGPAITEKRHGSGRALYVGTAPDDDTLRGWLVAVCRDAGIEVPVVSSDGLEIVRRTTGRSALTWAINHAHQPATLTLPAGSVDLLTGKALSASTTLEPFGVLLTREDER